MDLTDKDAPLHNDEETMTGTAIEETPLHERRVSLSSRNTTYQSDLFSARAGVNPMLTAASALLYLGTEIEHLPPGTNPLELHQALTHEVKAFESAAQAAGYRANTILAARYALCSWIDETIQFLGNKISHQWTKMNLLGTFQQENWGGERFFLIMDRGSEEPEQHLDLLEMLYLCIRLGYEGKYREERRGQNKLDTRADQLFELIRFQRGEFSRTLLSMPLLPNPDQESTSYHAQDTHSGTSPLWWGLTLVALLGFGWTYQQASTTLDTAYSKLNAQPTISAKHHTGGHA